MTHFLRKMAAAWIILGSVSVGFAQQQTPPIPTDPNVRIGKLDNGLTYYIRHNELPEKRADFYIAQKVGSILEEDNQRGLAHFLEHMCFNGTKNFPDKTLIQYLESIGVKFGENLNAYTSIDETVYNISNVPVIRDGVVDSCLLILHDWADDLTLDPKEIDSERGVIHEEWRTSTNAMMRMYEKALPTLYPESKYAYRLPIGIMEVVDNFPYQALRDYYEKWYRPDQQGIVVVGDIDVDKIEAKIIKAKKNYGYARAIGFKNSRGWEKTFTAEMIKNKKGSCYHFAALYAFLAKESGVEARICLGRTNGFNKARWQDHAWCEVKVGKKWYICDPNMDKFAANSKGKYFMKTVSSMKSTFKKSKTIKVNF